MPDPSWIRHPVSKVLAVGDPGRPMEFLEAARAHFAGRAEVTVSHPEFLEFLAPGVSKGQAVRWLARRLGIPLDQALAMGDQFNDLEMIAGTGHGVAMPSSRPVSKAVARYLAPPLEEEGAAQIIEGLVLGWRRGTERRAFSSPGARRARSGPVATTAAGAVLLPTGAAQRP